MEHYLLNKEVRKVKISFSEHLISANGSLKVQRMQIDERKCALIKFCVMNKLLFNTVS